MQLIDRKVKAKWGKAVAATWLKNRPEIEVVNK